MAQISLSMNFDYRCPFARNANEHMVLALKDGADYDVTFKAFSLDQPHAPEGGPTVWENPQKLADQVAVAAGIVVRDRYPAQFFEVHQSLFGTRHDGGNDFRDRRVIAKALIDAGLDADAVFAEIDDGWPMQVFAQEHLDSVAKYDVFGVPTFIYNDQAVFVRVMTRPKGDARLARATIERIVGLLVGAPEINEYKHTTVQM